MSEHTLVVMNERVEVPVGNKSRVVYSKGAQQKVPRELAEQWKLEGKARHPDDPPPDGEPEERSRDLVAQKVEHDPQPVFAAEPPPRVEHDPPKVEDDPEPVNVATEEHDAED